MSDGIHLFNEIELLISELKAENALSEDKLAKINAEIESANKELADTIESLDVAKTTTSAEIANLEAEAKPYSKEVNRLKDEVIALNSQKAELKLENARLSEQNAKFAQYEHQARKALKTAESSLMEREKNIRERESLRPIDRTILPPEN